MVSVLDGILADLVLAGSASTRVSGGEFGGSILAEQNSSVDIRRVAALAPDSQFLADQAGVLTLHGSDFALDGTPIDFGKIESVFGGSYADEPERWLSGTLASGYAFNQQIAIGGSAFISVIPEPSSGLLVGLALTSMALRQRRPGAP